MDRTWPTSGAAPHSTPTSASGKDYWRSLEEWSHSPEFRDLAQRRFPHYLEDPDPISRRRFLTLLAASLALGGLTGCGGWVGISPPRETIVPYVHQPEGIVPGRPRYFATAFTFGDDLQGLLVQTREGRPIKIEGNPDHPSNLRPLDSPEFARFGPSDVFAQAMLLSMYDPDRSQNVTHLGRISTWESFQLAFRSLLHRHPPATLRLAILTQKIASPSEYAQLGLVLRHFPAARWYAYEPALTDHAHVGSRLAFGRELASNYHVDEADVILALDADFLCLGPDHVRHSRDFMVRRRVRRGEQSVAMNRLYVVEPHPTGTGKMADHRLPLRAQAIGPFLRALAGKIDDRFRPLAIDAPVAAGWLDALADDLREHRGRSLVVAGEAQPPYVHALAAGLNVVLANVGRTVTFTDPVHAAEPLPLSDLVEAMAGDRVDALLILGGNPVYDAPADYRFRERLERVLWRAHLSLDNNETSVACDWHVPQAHFLESWADVRARNGVVSIVQPVITPLYQGKTIAEMLDTVLSPTPRPAYEIVRSYWASLFRSDDPDRAANRNVWERQGLASAFSGSFEAWWRQALHDGVVRTTRLPARSVSFRQNWTDDLAAQLPASPRSQEMEIVFRLDPSVYDGRFANNAWLQELPRPYSKITWDNAAYLSPATAVRLGLAEPEHPEVASGKVVELTFDGRRIDAPVWVLPGQADDSIAVMLGYGRNRAGRVGNAVGFDAFPLRTSQTPWFAAGVDVQITNRRHEFATTQHHHLMEGRGLVQAGTASNPPEVPRPPRQSLTLYNLTERSGATEQWGMVIDLNLCTGCNSCVVACQAENNIPVVGKEEVSRGREMHWLRIDHYYSGEPTNPDSYFQPIPCMHCETAPCELVCPVAATVHSEDGLNDMIYNRCVGTRYCSNNCPYKVRRFNYLPYSDFESVHARLRHNPDVTVRGRGVIEKCTYCVQRIRIAQIEAQKEDRPVRDGEVQTACQSACPAGAIVFGNLAQRNQQGHPATMVAQLRQEPQHYGLLEELNTRPRTTYLAVLKNPNPRLQT